MDDPKFIGGFSTDVYVFCSWVIGILAAVWAITSLLTLVKGFLSKTEQGGWWRLGFVAGLVAFGLLFSLLVSGKSPGNAIMWFID
jgi:hypothetical protein